MPLDYSILPNCKETLTNSKKLLTVGSSRTSLTGLGVLLRNATINYYTITLMNP